MADLKFQSIEVFRCLVKACAPPPVGKGGSLKEAYIAREYGEKMLAKAKAADPRVTKDIESTFKRHGGSAEGLKHRVKGLGSLTRKIYDKAKQRGQTFQQSAKRIGDSLRYTSMVDTDNYTAHVRAVLKDLKTQGYNVVELENHWTRGDAYNGTHAVLRDTRSGLRIEVQFHTPESLAAKERNHRMYERARISKDPEERARLNAKMTAISDRAPVPKGATRIGKKIYRP